MTNLMSNLIHRARGHYPPETHYMLVGKSLIGNLYILESTLPIDFFDGEDNLEYVFSGEELKPLSEIQPGVYVLNLTSQTFRSNNPQDPEEWETSFKINNFRRIQALNNNT